MFAASLLPRTERLIFATGVINAPLRHPALIAAEAAQFDHMSKGRFILGIGTGSTPTDIELMDVSTDPKLRAQMLVESESRGALQRFMAAWQDVLRSTPQQPEVKGVIRWAIDVDPLSI